MGYTLAVTLEIADATLGGLAFGVGMTTYSHKVFKVGTVQPISKVRYSAIRVMDHRIMVQFGYWLRFSIIAILELS